MSRVVGRWLLALLLCTLTGCGDDAPNPDRPSEEQIRLLKTLRSELAAKVAEMPEAADAWKTYQALQRTDEWDAADEDGLRADVARVFELRDDIIDLELRIQRIEGFWDPIADIQALRDPKLRDGALRRLFERNPELIPHDGWNEASCRVNHVVWCPQPEGPPMVAVFKAEDWDEDGGPGRAAGHVILFLASGTHVPFFQGANFIEPTGLVRDVTGDGRVEVIDVIPCGGAEEGYFNLYVLPVVPEMKDTLQVWWRETHDAQGDEVEWGFAAVEGKDAPAIVIGPRDAEGGIDERARYEWSAADGRWVGPPGSSTGDFYRPDQAVDENPQVEAFTSKRALKPKPGAGKEPAK